MPIITLDVFNTGDESLEICFEPWAYNHVITPASRSHIRLLMEPAASFEFESKEFILSLHLADSYSWIYDEAMNLVGGDPVRDSDVVPEEYSQPSNILDLRWDTLFGMTCLCATDQHPDSTLGADHATLLGAVHATIYVPGRARVELEAI